MRIEVDLDESMATGRKEGRDDSWRGWEMCRGVMDGMNIWYDFLDTVSSWRKRIGSRDWRGLGWESGTGEEFGACERHLLCSVSVSVIARKQLMPARRRIESRSFRPPGCNVSAFIG
jgi:hypothetical protein